MAGHDMSNEGGQHGVNQFEYLLVSKCTENHRADAGRASIPQIALFAASAAITLWLQNSEYKF